MDSIGPETVYSQHQQYLFHAQRDDNPRKALYKDLFDEVLANGKGQASDHIIIGLDANEDVWTGNTKNTF